MFVYHDAWTITLTTSIGVFLAGEWRDHAGGFDTACGRSALFRKKTGQKPCAIVAGTFALNLLYKNHDPSQSSA